jgi:SAM-dependent methyltransferase
MEKSAFDRVARDYEKIHDRSLPPGVHSEEFVVQRAAKVIEWIGGGGGGGAEFCYLDFGCGNGRMFRRLLEAPALKPRVAQGRLRLFGLDTSRESLREAAAIADDPRVGFVGELSELPEGLRFDLVAAFNVFHHIDPAERGAVAGALRARMKPGGRLVIWEHNPFNPLTRVLVKVCPFDADARLLRVKTARRLFEANAFGYLRHRHVNVFPPGWLRWGILAAVERKLATLPIGAQYWAMFANHGHPARGLEGL